METGKSGNMVIPVCAFAVVFALVWIHFSGGSIIMGDSFILYAPHKFLISKALKSGFIFGWYPWQFLGLPFVGDVLAGWFYPLNIVYLIFPFGLAHKLFILAHYPLAAFSMHTLLRKIDVSEISATVGSVTFSLGGYMVCKHMNMAFLIGPAWAPLAIYFTVRALRESAIFSLGAGAVICLQILGGEPQSAAISGALAAFMCMHYAVWPDRWRAAETGGRKAFVVARCVAIVCSIFAFAALLGAAQILPTIDLMKSTTRAAGLDVVEAVTFSFHPARLVEFFWPNPFGRLLPDKYYWAEFALSDVKEYRLPWSITNYMGLSIIASAIIGIIYSRKKMKFWIAAGALVFLILGMGGNTAVYPFLHKHLPLFGSFRYPEKYIAWFAGFMVLAAAMGLDVFQEWLDNQPRRVIRLGAIYTAVTAVAAAICFFSASSIAGTVATGVSQDELNFIRDYLWGTDKIFSAINLPIGLSILFVGYRPAYRKQAAAIFLALMFVDYYANNIKQQPVGPSDIYESFSSTARAITEKNPYAPGKYRIAKIEMFLRISSPEYDRLDMFSGTAVWQRSTMDGNLGAFDGMESFLGYNAIKFAEYSWLKDFSTLPRKLEAFNVFYTVSHFFGVKPFEGINNTPLIGNKRDDILVVAIPDAFPRAYFVETAYPARNFEEAAALFESIDLRKAAVISTSENLPPPHAGDSGMKPAAVTLYRPDRVIVEFNADKPGWLVLSDRYFPGWSAYSNGAPVKIYKANVVVRAVRVDRGAQKIEFFYRPAALRIGMFASLVTALTCILFFITRCLKILKNKSIRSFSTRYTHHAG